MTFEQYIANPMGKNNAVMSSITRETLRKEYTHRFDNILLRENGKVNYKLYKDEKNNTYWIHIKIPSEKVKNFYYDTVIKFYSNEKVSGAGKDLLKYDINFFSNDPAFVYTYAHVFAKKDLFIKELRSKMSKEAIRKEAKEKNPDNNVGYVKSLFFAYLVIKNRGLNSITKFNAECKPLDDKNKMVLLSEIEEADTVIRKRQEEGSKVSNRKKITVDSKTFGNLKKYTNSDSGYGDIRVATTKSVGKIKRNDSISSTKRVGIIKKK